MFDLIEEMGDRERVSQNGTLLISVNLKQVAGVLGTVCLSKELVKSLDLNGGSAIWDAL